MLLARFPYRPIALILGLFFLLFTAGLPLALTFCPMNDTFGEGQCPMCMSHASEGPASTAAFDNDGSCCTIVHSASSDAEYLHARTALESMQKSIPAPLITFVPVRVSDSFADYSFTHEILLTRSDDIPVSTSSLLI